MNLDPKKQIKLLGFNNMFDHFVKLLENKHILSINGVTGIFLSEEFLSVNKKEEINWDDL